MGQVSGSILFALKTWEALEGMALYAHSIRIRDFPLFLLHFAQNRPLNKPLKRKDDHFARWSKMGHVYLDFLCIFVSESKERIKSLQNMFGNVSGKYDSDILKKMHKKLNFGDSCTILYM